MRSERWWVCLRCFARQVRLDACVRCGATDLVDLRTPSGRATLAQHTALAAQERELVAEQSGREALALAIGVGLGGVVLLAQLAAGIDSTLLIPTALLAGLLAPLFVLALLRRRDPDPSRLLAMAPRLECADRIRAEVAAAPLPLTRVTGRVRITRGVRAPVSGTPCAAARIQGVAFGEVDDALCGAFDLLDAHGNVIARYDGGSAWVDVPLGPEQLIERVEGPLREFLDERMVHREGGRAILAEGTVREGARVTLEGPAEDGMITEGYRNSRAVKIFRGTAAWPVALRAEASPHTGVRVSFTPQSQEEASSTTALEAWEKRRSP